MSGELDMTWGAPAGKHDATVRCLHVAMLGDQHALSTSTAAHEWLQSPGQASTRAGGFTGPVSGSELETTALGAGVARGAIRRDGGLLGAGAFDRR